VRAEASLILVLLVLAGCLGGATPKTAAPDGLAGDPPLRLPSSDFFNRTGKPAYSGGPAQGMTPANAAQPFHTLTEIAAHVEAYADEDPGLVRVDVIGSSRQGRPLWDVVVTDRNTTGPKAKALIDGGHHGNEIAGVELALYVVDFLLENRANATVRGLLRSVELHVVPIVNPDGYAAQTRGNALGVNLNRNYDVDWGDPYGASNPVMGKLSSTTGQNVPSVIIVAENCGDAAFSEPETRAMRDLMEGLGRDFAFYLSFHTPTNGFIGNWAAGKAPYTMPPRDSAVEEAELQWVRTHTEYAAGKAQWGNFSAGLPYSASGSSADWAYLRHHVPGYTLELEFWVTSIVDPDYVERNLGPYAGLPYWMQASLPIPWHLLVNAENYVAWQLPAREVPLPPGVPPPVPSGGFDALGSLGMFQPQDEGAPEDPGRWPLAA
jgi:zinc carboxypeptidase